MIHDVVPRHKIWEPDGLPCTIHLHDVVAISSRHTKTGMQVERKKSLPHCGKNTLPSTSGPRPCPTAGRAGPSAARSGPWSPSRRRRGAGARTSLPPWRRAPESAARGGTDDKAKVTVRMGYGPTTPTTWSRLSCCAAPMGSRHFPGRTAGRRGGRWTREGGGTGNATGRGGGRWQGATRRPLGHENYRRLH